jgi:tetratricopeptide (TPR) repeat protein
LFKRTLTIYENSLGPDHPDVGIALNFLAALYQAQHRYAEAEPLFKRSLAILEKALGPDHPNIPDSLNNLAGLYTVQGRYADALPFIKRVMTRNAARKSVALPLFYESPSQNLISATEALSDSYNVLQRSSSSSAGEAVSKLAARFAADNDELAQFVRKDQDLTVEAERLDKLIIAAVSKAPAERNTATEDQIRSRIENIKTESYRISSINVFPSMSRYQDPNR